MNKILLLTNKIDPFPKGGRELLCKLNHDILKQIYKNNCILLELPKEPMKSITEKIKAFNGHIDGISSKLIRKVLNEIKTKNIEKVFIDGSNLGELAKRIKVKYPQVRIYTFFHNVESKFFLDSLKQNYRLHTLAVYIVNYLAEKKAVKYSDKIICINERDSQLLQKTYGESATDIYPMALEDKLPSNHTSLVHEIKEKFVLFVGGTFYANRVGITWFVKNVAPSLHIKTYIVGRGFEKFRSELELNDKVIVIGEVEDLSQWYHDATFIIAPIFDGSGMKTKVAEALMYGKKIIGTPEAFVGYEDIINEVGLICTTDNEFITAINNEEKKVISSFYLKLRKIYEESYSLKSAKDRMKNIIKDKK